MNDSKNTTAKRLAKNTFLMYIRMIALIVLSIYSSRVLLKQLGVEDFGLYNLVGSVIGLFVSVRMLFASSTQRFLNVEMGKGNATELNHVFSLSVLVNIMISVIFAVLVEVVGVWFIYNKINIAPDKIPHAFWILHFSVASSIVSIMTTPYDAVIIANEKMNFYAYMSIIEGILKLVIIYALSVFSDSERVVYYAALLFIVSIIIRVANAAYCKRNFEESKFNYYWNKEYFKEMLSFAGWQMFGNTSCTLANNGVNMLLNVYGGPIVNAARGIAYQVNMLTLQFVSNISVVITPFCVKSYAEDNKDKLFQMIFFSSKVFYFIEVIIFIPLFVLTDEVLTLWLGTVPDYTLIFVQYVLIWAIIRAFHPAIDILYKAYGKIKVYQISEGIILMMPLISSVVLLKLGFGIETPFQTFLLFEFVNLIVTLIEAKYIAELPLGNYLRKVVLPCFIGFIVLFGVLEHLSTLGLSLFYKIIEIVIAYILFFLYVYLICTDSNEHKLLIGLVNRK